MFSTQTTTETSTENTPTRVSRNPRFVPLKKKSKAHNTKNLVLQMKKLFKKVANEIKDFDPELK